MEDAETAEASYSGSHSLSMANLEETDAWRINEDVVELIVERLSLHDVCALRACSRFFHSLCSSDHIWIHLFKQRWPCLRLKANKDSEGTDATECTVIAPCSLHVRYKLPHQGWLETYANLHVEMRCRANTVIDLVKNYSLNESVEGYDYQKVMALLSEQGLGFHDVLLYLLTPAQGVLLNLIGLHFCFLQFHLKITDLKAALKMNNVGTRLVCLRWWTMGAGPMASAGRMSCTFA